MEQENDFNEKYRVRTKRFAIEICRLFKDIQNGESKKIIVRQLIRSGTSVAANFRAATRARSLAEYYAKICIVVEECDETQFWFEILAELNLCNKEQIDHLYKENSDLLRILTTTKKKLKLKLNSSS
jgi:four helix bundle protein